MDWAELFFNQQRAQLRVGLNQENECTGPQNWQLFFYSFSSIMLIEISIFLIQSRVINNSQNYDYKYLRLIYFCSFYFRSNHQPIILFATLVLYKINNFLIIFIFFCYCIWRIKFSIFILQNPSLSDMSDIKILLILLYFFFHFPFLISSKIRRNLQQNTNNNNPTIVRLVANSQGGSQVVNTTIKTTVSIPESFLTAMNALVNQGVVTSSKINGTLNPLEKYAALKSDPMGVLSTLTSSTLVPVITKITTISNTSSFNNKTKQDNVAGIINLSDGSVLTTAQSLNAPTQPPQQNYLSNSIQPSNFNPSVPLQMNYPSNIVSPNYYNPYPSNPYYPIYPPYPYPTYPIQGYGFPTNLPVYPGYYPQMQFQQYPNTPALSYNQNQFPLNPSLTYPPIQAPASTILSTQNQPSVNPFASKYNYEVIDERQKQKNTQSTNQNSIPMQFSQFSQMLDTKNQQDQQKSDTSVKSSISIPSNELKSTIQNHVPAQTVPQVLNLGANLGPSSPIDNRNKNDQNSISSIINPLNTGIDSSSSSSSQNPANSAVKTNIITNIITDLLPTLSLYGIQSISQPHIPQYNNVNEQKNLSINLSNQSQTFNTNNQRPNNSNLDPNGLTNGQADFSIKLEQSSKTSSNDIKVGVNSQTLSNIDTASQMVTVLSVYTNKNAQNLVPSQTSNSASQTSSASDNKGTTIALSSASAPTPTPASTPPSLGSQTPSSKESILSIQKVPQNVIKEILKAPLQLQPLSKVKIEYENKQTGQIKISYEQYIDKFNLNKQYLSNPQVLAYRSKIFQANLNKINSHNNRTTKSYSMGLNIFAHFQQQQFRRIKLSEQSILIPDQIKNIISVQQSLLDTDPYGREKFTTPSNIAIDWSCYASQAIDDGVCAASYALVPLESIAITSRANSEQISYLSIQQIISCGKNGKTINGCSGGYFSGPYSYVKNFGVGQSLLYYYDISSRAQGKVPQCDFQIIKNVDYRKNKKFIKDSQRVRYGDCHQVVNQLRTRALSVAISGNELQFYSGGTFTTSSPTINHGVTLVGYHPTKKYLIKNSWGTNWGINGFAYVSESAGVCSYAMYPILLKQREDVKDCS